MASRMDRYYNSKSSMERSRKNKDLYRKMRNEYHGDIDSLDSISRANEIDLSKLKSIVSDRETYKKERKLKESIGNSNLKIDLPAKEMDDARTYDILDIKPEKVDTIDTKEKIKNYDLSSVLSKARDDYNETDSKNRNLQNLEYTDLNNLNLHKKEYKNSELELKDMIKSIHDTSNLNKFANEADDIGLLDSLKADTMIGDSSIKKVIDKDNEVVRRDDTKELDKSFFTNTFDFGDADFDEGFAKKKGKKKKIIIAIIICLVVAGAILGLYFTGMINFKSH